MSLMRKAWRRPTVALSLLALAAGLATGCTGQTAVSEETPKGLYDVAVSMDPGTLNPPALGTLTYSVTNTKTGKPVTEFEPVNTVLMQTIIIHKDLLFFRHSFTDRLLMNAASVPAAFPRQGTYYVWNYYKPAKDQTQVYNLKITSGTESDGPNLAEDSARAKVSSGVGVQLLKGAEPYRVGQPQQLAFRVTERGYPISSIWPYLGAPGHLWIVDDVNEGRPTLAHEVGSAASRVLIPNATPGANGQNGLNGFPNSGDISGSDEKLTGPQVTAAPPTFAPNVASALAPLTSQPVPTLLPVQQTPQSSIIGTPAVVPAIGYGPEVAFTHTFPHAGLYKMWFEIEYNRQVITTDFVVRVVQ